MQASQTMYNHLFSSQISPTKNNKTPSLER